jgi:hypothetical protein
LDTGPASQIPQTLPFSPQVRYVYQKMLFFSKSSIDFILSKNTDFGHSNTKVQEFFAKNRHFPKITENT